MRLAAPTPVYVAVLYVVAGCSGQDDPGAANADVPTGGSVSPLASGSGGSGEGGANVAGLGAGGAAGASGAGTGGGGTAGTSGAGTGGGGGAAGTSVAGVGGGAGSSAGASGSAGAIPADFATVKLVLGGGGGIMPCAAAPCHGVGGVAPPAKPLELPPTDDLQLYANLTSYVSEACSQTKLVEPGNPAQSALLRILRGPCGMTPRMPYGCDREAGDCIPDEYITAVEQWIANGAPPP